MLPPARYRQMHEPLLELIGRLDAAAPERSVAVVIPEIVKRHWWDDLLHERARAGFGGCCCGMATTRVRVIVAPWRPQGRRPLAFDMSLALYRRMVEVISPPPERRRVRSGTESVRPAVDPGCGTDAAA